MKKNIIIENNKRILNTMDQKKEQCVWEKYSQQQHRLTSIYIYTNLHTFTFDSNTVIGINVWKLNRKASKTRGNNKHSFETRQDDEKNHTPPCKQMQCTEPDENQVPLYFLAQKFKLWLIHVSLCNFDLLYVLRMSSGRVVAL